MKGYSLEGILVSFIGAHTKEGILTTSKGYSNKGYESLFFGQARDTGSSLIPYLKKEGLCLYPFAAVSVPSLAKERIQRRDTRG